MDYGCQIESDFKSLYSFIFDWNVIKYKEKKGISRIFDKLLVRKSEYFTGDYEENTMTKLNSSIYPLKGNYYLFLFRVRMRNQHGILDEYSRKKITELDIISTISALFAPIKLIFSFIYSFYSKNFENYKLIEEILNVNFFEYKKYNKTNFKNQLLNKNDILKDINKDINKNENMENRLIPVDEDSDINNEDLILNNNLDDIKIIKENRKLPKFNFIEFFFNNLYCKKCKRNKRQEILEINNNIVMK